MTRLHKIENWAHTPQDSATINESGTAGGAFDGLGGADGSEHASRIAKEALESFYGQEPYRGWSRDIISSARGDLVMARLEGPYSYYRHMSTTAVVACYVEDEDEWDIASCGDSRAYAKQEGSNKPVLLTKDSDFIGQLEISGDVGTFKSEFLRSVVDSSHSESEAFHKGGPLAKKAFRHRNIVYSDLSMGFVDVSTVSGEGVEYIFLTTDGVHDNLSTEEIEEVISKSDVDTLAKNLCEAAKAVAETGEGRAKPDDITCVVLSK